MRFIIALMIGLILSTATLAEDMMGFVTKALGQMQGSGGQKEISDLEAIIKGANPAKKAEDKSATSNAPPEQQKTANSYICITRKNEEKVCRDYSGKLTHIPLQANEEKNHDPSK